MTSFLAPWAFVLSVFIFGVVVGFVVGATFGSRISDED